MKIKHTIKSPVGIHARPAGFFAKTASAFQSVVTVQCKGNSANGKKLFELMKLGAQTGDEIEIEISGADEKETLDALQSFIKEQF